MTNPHHSENHQTPEEFELSQDQELWNLLGQSQSKDASSLLSRNVLREIRLEESESSATPSFWKSLLTPRFLVPSAFAALALTAAVVWNPTFGSKDSLAKTGESEVLPTAVATAMETSLESELLLAAADTPGLFSDEEVIAMLF